MFSNKEMTIKHEYIHCPNKGSDYIHCKYSKSNNIIIN